MPRSKEIPEEVRKKVIEAYQSGKGYKAISKDLGLQRTTVRNIVVKWKRFGTTMNLPKSGRPAKITLGVINKIIREVKENPHATYKDLQASLALDKICVHNSTISRTVCKERILGSDLPPKPSSTKNCGVSVKHAKEESG